MKFKNQFKVMTLSLMTSLGTINIATATEATQTEAAVNLPALPEEIFVKIFSYLDIKDTANTMSVSKQFYRILCEKQAKDETELVTPFCNKDYMSKGTKEEVQKAAKVVIAIPNSKAGNYQAPLSLMKAKLHAYAFLYYSNADNAPQSFQRGFLELYEKALPQDKEGLPNTVEKDIIDNSY